MGEGYDLGMDKRNAVVGRVAGVSAKPEEAYETLRVLADRFRQTPLLKPQPAREEEELMKAWGQAGAEALGLMGDFLEGTRPFDVEIVPPGESRHSTSVLARVQENLTQPRPTEDQRIPQDCSLQ